MPVHISKFVAVKTKQNGEIQRKKGKQVENKKIKNYFSIENAQRTGANFLHERVKFHAGAKII